MNCTNDEEIEEEAPEETPVEETPVEETPEEVAPPTTEPPRPGNSGKDKVSPPGRGKKATSPKAFTLMVAAEGVTALWDNDPDATKYRLECALTVANALRNRPDFVLELLPNEATLLPNRQRQFVLPPEALANSRCWLLAEQNGEASDPSNVELVPWTTARPGNSGNAPGLPGPALSNPGNSGSAPGLSGSTPGNSGNTPGNTPGNAPGNTPGNSGNAPGNAPGNAGTSGNNTTPAPAPAATPAPATRPAPPVAPGPPASLPGNTGNTPGRNNR